MRKHGRPEVMVTDRLRSYGAALKAISAGDRQETGRWLNNRAESTNLPFRRRKRAMQRFTLPSTIILICSEATQVDTTSSSTAPLLLLSGTVFARHNGQCRCPCGDWFELVCQPPQRRFQAACKQVEARNLRIRCAPSDTKFNELRKIRAAWP